MTDQLERQLVAGFQDYAADVRLGPDVLDAATARHHRRTNARRAVVAGGVASGAAALSAVLVLGGTGQPPAAGPPPAATAAAQTPALRLAAAAAATGQTSFRLRLTLTQSYDTGRLKGYRESQDYEGAFDAAADRGYLRLRGTPIEIRIIGERVYTGRPDRDAWRRPMPRSELADVLGAANPATTSVFEQLTIDPPAVLEMLRHLGSVTPAGRSGSGSAAVDKYTFTYQVEADASTATHRVTGEVEIGVRSQLLARISQQTTTVGANPAIADGQPLTWRTVIAFSGYGTPVHVAKPGA